VRRRLAALLIVIGAALSLVAAVRYAEGWYRRDQIRQRWEAMQAHADVARARAFDIGLGNQKAAVGAPVARLVISRIGLDEVVIEAWVPTSSTPRRDICRVARSPVRVGTRSSQLTATAISIAWANCRWVTRSRPKRASSAANGWSSRVAWSTSMHQRSSLHRRRRSRSRPAGRFDSSARRPTD